MSLPYSFHFIPNYFKWCKRISLKINLQKEKKKEEKRQNQH